MYRLWVGLGIVVGLVAARFSRDTSGLSPDLRRKIGVAALLGAVAGAYLFELPADLLGWAAPAHGADAHGLVLFGRTLLGGLLGGFLSVEIAKLRLGVRRRTGDRFALPVAVSLAFGRVGCLFGGCCAGRPVEPGSALARLAMQDPAGILRVPVPLIEAYFHGIAALILLVASHRGLCDTRRFSIYVAAYAALRFGLEFLRENPEILLGLTYYQLLAVPLFILGAMTAFRRGSGLLVSDPRVG